MVRENGNPWISNGRLLLQPKTGTCTPQRRNLTAHSDMGPTTLPWNSRNMNWDEWIKPGSHYRNFTPTKQTESSIVIQGAVTPPQCLR
ncbi:hypothetical protein IFR05_017431 [Cadophora sp. M221]|nr:hypothetical protein IFR05_017431 [Cadophora sp. M221]